MRPGTEGLSNTQNSNAAARGNHQGKAVQGERFEFGSTTCTRYDSSPSCMRIALAPPPTPPTRPQPASTVHVRLSCTEVNPKQLHNTSSCRGNCTVIFLAKLTSSQSNLLSMSCVLALWLVAACLSISGASSVVIQSSCGPIEGIHNTETDVASFLGIPYARMVLLVGLHDLMQFLPVSQKHPWEAGAGHMLKISKIIAGSEP